MKEKLQLEDKKDYIKLSIPNKPEYVGMVRLTASAIASGIGFNIEEIDDIKVAIAEACTNALEHGLKGQDVNFDIEFTIYNDRLSIVIRDNGEGFNVESVKEPNAEDLKERGLGMFIIKSLMDEFEVFSQEGKGTEIRMTKKVEGGIQ